MRSGPIYPPLAENCPVAFLNQQHMEILAGGYEMLATIVFSGRDSEMDRVAERIPGAVVVGVCKLGGDAVSLANTLDTSGASALQFVVWRSPVGTAAAAKPTPGADPSAPKQI